MSILKTIKGWIAGMFKGKAKELFDIETITTAKMDSFVRQCVRIYQGTPDWLDDDDEIKTINFAEVICAETARLATLAIGVRVDGSSRAEYLQKQIDKVYYSLRTWVEYGLAYGTIVLKPSTDGVELFTNERCILTDRDGDNVTGAVFVFNEEANDVYYTRLEYHRFAEDGAYLIDNKCFKGKAENDMREAVGIDQTPWAGLLESARIDNLEKPLFAVFRTPNANNIELDSVQGMPIFATAIEELKDLDIAYSRNATEINDSKRTVLMDADKLFPFGRMSDIAALDKTIATDRMRDKMGMPKYVRMVEGDGNTGFYQEINPTLNTVTREEGINFLLSVIGFKCGFSNGYFVLDQKTGMVTATQVESDDRRTIQTIKDVRDKLQKCIEDLVYGMDIMADLYFLAPVGEYELIFDFGDITYNREEDRSRWWSYVMSNKVPAWMFFVKFEGMTEEDAKAMVSEATPKEEGLFPE
ncbi:MAG: hypothetical protein KBT34_09830 [Prevotella sp.]|nr:hypothetical protein [Candidatus Prevotella equi]